jgi:putative tricarboxylic transport membrane protein
MRRFPSVLLAGTALLYVYEARSFDAGFIADPIGPKAFPYVIGFLALAASALLLREAVEPEVRAIDVPFTLRATLLVLALSGWIWVLDEVGFVLATTVLMGTLVLVFRGPVRPGFAGALLVSAFIYTLFVYAFSIPLPFGSLFGGT